MGLRAIVFSLALALPGLAMAQGAQVAFGDDQRDPNAPVEVTADALDVDQSNGTATFTGNVLIVQGPMRMTGDVVDVNYGPDAAGGTQIERVHARGGVTLVNGQEAAEANEAVYTITSGDVVMTGDVLVTQDGNAMAGDKLTVNLDSGSGVMEGRVRVLFLPADEANQDGTTGN